MSIFAGLKKQLVLERWAILQRYYRTWTAREWR